MKNNLLLSLALVVALFSACNENSDPEIGGGGNEEEKPVFGTYLTGDFHQHGLLGWYESN